MNTLYHWMHLSTIGRGDISDHDKRALSSHTSLVYPPLRAAAMLEDSKHLALATDEDYLDEIYSHISGGISFH